MQGKKVFPLHYSSTKGKISFGKVAKIAKRRKKKVSTFLIHSSQNMSDLDRYLFLEAQNTLLGDPFVQA